MSSRTGPSPWHAVIAAVNVRVRKRLEQCLTELGVTSTAVSLGELSGVHPKPTVYCVDSRYLDGAHLVPGPTVLVVSGSAIVDTALLAAARPNVVAVRLAELTASTLLQAIVSAVLGNSHVDLVDELLEATRATGLPSEVVIAFLHDPPSVQKRLDLELALGRSRRWVQSMVEGAGSRRVTFLLKALRAQAWVVLVRRGVAPRVAQEYLGIKDRSTFRRACRRAGVPVPWEVGSGCG